MMPKVKSKLLVLKTNNRGSKVHGSTKRARTMTKIKDMSNPNTIPKLNNEESVRISKIGSGKKF